MRAARAYVSSPPAIVDGSPPKVAGIVGGCARDGKGLF